MLSRGLWTAFHVKIIKYQNDRLVDALILYIRVLGEIGLILEQICKIARVMQALFYSLSWFSCRIFY